MGKPLPQGVGASGTPPAGEPTGSAVVSGSLVAAGQTSLPFCFWGPFNVAIYPSLTTQLVTRAASASATVSVPGGGGIAAGESITSTAVPAGATVASIGTLNLSGLNTLQLGGLSTAQVAGISAVTDPSAIFIGLGVGAVGTVQLEKSFDGGSSWLAASIPNTDGTPAIYVFGSGGLTNSVSFTVSEPELYVAYRLNCTAYTSGTFTYRLSATGPAARPWAPGGG